MGEKAKGLYWMQQSCRGEDIQFPSGTAGAFTTVLFADLLWDDFVPGLKTMVVDILDIINAVKTYKCGETNFRKK